MIIRNLSDLCNWAGAELPRNLNRRVYKDTACGASLSLLLKHAPKCDPCTRYFSAGSCSAHVGTGECDCPICHGSCGCRGLAWIHNGDPRWQELPIDTEIDGFTIQTIVEGSDAEVNSDTFYVPIDSAVVDAFIKEMEADAATLWDEANSGDGDDYTTLTLICEVAGTSTVEDARAKLNAFREAVLPAENYGLTIYEAARTHPDPDVNWQNDAIQFPRLLVELQAILRPDDYAEVAVAMDLEVSQVHELFTRAQTEWDAIIRDGVPKERT